MAVMSGNELANALSKFVNCMANDKNEKEFIRSVLRDHRTLQQNTFGLIQKLIVAWSELAEDEFCYDLRNEYTVKTCKEILDKVPQVNCRPPCI